jgi:hypothetical protein
LEKNVGFSEGELQMRENDALQRNGWTVIFIVGDYNMISVVS